MAYTTTIVTTSSVKARCVHKQFKDWWGIDWHVTRTYWLCKNSHFKQVSCCFWNGGIHVMEWGNRLLICHKINEMPANFCGHRFCCYPKQTCMLLHVLYHIVQGVLQFDMEIFSLDWIDRVILVIMTKCLWFKGQSQICRLAHVNKYNFCMENDKSCITQFVCFESKSRSNMRSFIHSFIQYQTNPISLSTGCGNFLRI